MFHNTNVHSVCTKQNVLWLFTVTEDLSAFLCCHHEVKDSTNIQDIIYIYIYVHISLKYTEHIHVFSSSTSLRTNFTCLAPQLVSFLQTDKSSRVCSSSDCNELCSL